MRSLSRKLSLDPSPNGVVVLTLADPERRNAIGLGLAEELREAARQLTSDATARALIVTGAGTAFCAGADRDEVLGRRDLSVAEWESFLRSFYESFLWIRDLPCPTIAAVNGPAIGAGLNLALACDIRIAGPEATFGVTFARMGLHPGGGCTWFLAQALGRQRALRVLLQGEILDATTAVSVGLADQLSSDPLEAALVFASSLGGLDIDLVRNIKRAVDLTSDGFDTALEFEARAQAASLHAAAVRIHDSPIHRS